MGSVRAEAFSNEPEKNKNKRMVRSQPKLKEGARMRPKVRVHHTHPKLLHFFFL